MRSVLFTGGCRSGKSGLAQRWVERMGCRRAYVATARGVAQTGNPADSELADRVQRHQQVRGDSWFTIEPDVVSPHGPLDAAAALELAVRGGAEAILFDCVTLWLSDQPLHDEPALLSRFDALLRCVAAVPVPLALVTNELGNGLVPDNAASRGFRDMAGLLNQRLADVCQGVVLVVCGQPLVLKGPDVVRPTWLAL